MCPAEKPDLPGLFDYFAAFKAAPTALINASKQRFVYARA